MLHIDRACNCTDKEPGHCIPRCFGAAPPADAASQLFNAREVLNACEQKYGSAAAHAHIDSVWSLLDSRSIGVEK